ncbi:MAG: hypothetical protein EBZ77_00145 [Chitinophagia bacterium]|nr:hypothetical protein [Chitinophagia bacterium]
MGSGMEIIDTVYAAQKGIYCFSSPEGNCNAVGEHAVGMLLSLLRKLRDSHLEVVNGIWKREENRGWELEGKTVGIVGFGHTGRSFARKLMGFGVNILAYDKYSLDDIPAYVTPTNDITELYSAADILSFHVPLNADTHHYFNERFLQRMKKPFILINTSRGKVVSLQAVAQGLTEGRITGVCLDVYEEEPPSKITGAVQEAWKVIHSNPHAVLTPHIAGYTWEALYKMAATLVEKAPGAASLQLS